MLEVRHLRHIPSLGWERLGYRLAYLHIVCVGVVNATTQLHEHQFEVLGISIPGFLELRWNHDVGPQGVQGCDFRVKVITKTFGTQKPENPLLHWGPVLSPCRCQNSGAAGGALSSCATRSLWPARPWGLRVPKESHLLFISHPCNAMNPCLDLLEPFLSVSGSSQTMPGQDLTCIHTSALSTTISEFVYIFIHSIINIESTTTFRNPAEPSLLGVRYRTEKQSRNNFKSLNHLEKTSMNKNLK